MRQARAYNPLIIYVTAGLFIYGGSATCNVCQAYRADADSQHSPISEDVYAGSPETVVLLDCPALKPP